MKKILFFRDVTLRHWQSSSQHFERRCDFIVRVAQEVQRKI